VEEDKKQQDGSDQKAQHKMYALSFSMHDAAVVSFPRTSYLQL
jgi:hypothetical protein